MSSFINEKIHAKIGPIQLYSLTEKYCILILSSSPVFDPATNEMRCGGPGLGSTGCLVVSYVDLTLQAGLALQRHPRS